MIEITPEFARALLDWRQKRAVSQVAYEAQVGTYLAFQASGYNTQDKSRKLHRNARIVLGEAERAENNARALLLAEVEKAFGGVTDSELKALCGDFAQPK